LEEKGRLEELEAIKGGMGLYGKEQERLAGADRTTDFMRRYNLMLPEIMQRLGTNNPDDPKVKAATVKAVDASIGMAGQRVGVQQEGVGVRATEAGTNIETAVTASDEKINKEYNTRILMAQGDPEKEKSLIAERDAKKARRAAEIRRSGVGAAPTSGGASKADNDPLGIRR
jgi:hypothetical protein